MHESKMACECSDTDSFHGRKAERICSKYQCGVAFLIIFSLMMSSVAGSFLLALLYKTSSVNTVSPSAPSGAGTKVHRQQLPAKREAAIGNSWGHVEDALRAHCQTQGESRENWECLGNEGIASIMTATPASEPAPANAGQQDPDSVEQEEDSEQQPQDIPAPVRNTVAKQKAVTSVRPTPIGGLPGNIVKDFEEKEKAANKSGWYALKTAARAPGLPLSSLKATATRPEKTKTTFQTITRTPSVQARDAVAPPGWSTGTIYTTTHNGREDAVVMEYWTDLPLPFDKPRPEKDRNPIAPRGWSAGTVYSSTHDGQVDVIVWEYWTGPPVPVGSPPPVMARHITPASVAAVTTASPVPTT